MEDTVSLFWKMLTHTHTHTHNFMCSFRGFMHPSLRPSVFIRALIRHGFECDWKFFIIRWKIPIENLCNITQLLKPVLFPFLEDFAVDFPGVLTSQLDKMMFLSLNQWVLDRSLGRTWFSSYFHAHGCGISCTRKGQPDPSSLEESSSPSGSWGYC